MSADSEREDSREPRIKTDNAKKGESEVQLRLKLLDLIRVMQRIPTRPLPLTFFDRVKHEQLREVHRVYMTLVERDPVRARRHLESFLLSIAVEIKAVHEIRYVDADFMADYMLPQLEEDETVGPVADVLAAASDGEEAVTRPPGTTHLQAARPMSRRSQ